MKSQDYISNTISAFAQMKPVSRFFGNIKQTGGKMTAIINAPKGINP